MSFTIARTYNLVSGTDYTQRRAIKFQGSTTAGSANITITRTFTNENPLVAATTMTSPVLIGTGILKRDPVAGVAAGDIIQATNVATSTGTYEFHLIDDAFPSTYDMPIRGFHVLAAPGAFSFKTLDGATVNLPAGSLAVGGIYDYSIKEVINLTNANTVLGLSPEGQLSIL
jgi:hypothetical protein